MYYRRRQMKAKITMLINDYAKVGDEYKMVVVKKPFVCRNYDDMTNFVGTLYESMEVGDSITLRFGKEEEDE